jgi:hypothetical protein
VSDRVAALCKNVRADSRLIIQQGTFVWVGGRRVHARAEVDKNPRVTFAALDDDGCGIRTESRRVHEIFGGEDADLRRPLERRECLIERETDCVVVCNETRCLAGALKEMRERVGAIVKGTDDAGRCRHGHLRIITVLYFNC